ncbi:uncharacterized transmembrane protein DDB_G0289901-like isoform X2 [Anopheles albimanus]|nr:uncharacterized transmembrane protein DDB_G0289901-like isoform X2 [Anopheles albimanus]
MLPVLCSSHKQHAWIHETLTENAQQWRTMSSFGGSQSSGGANHYQYQQQQQYLYPSIEIADDGNLLTIVKQEQEPYGSSPTNSYSQQQQQQQPMMDALSSNPMLTTASMPIPSRNVQHQRMMMMSGGGGVGSGIGSAGSGVGGPGGASDLDFVEMEQQYHRQTGGGHLLHEVVSVGTGSIGSNSNSLGGGGGGNGLNVGSYSTTMPNQLDTIFTIQNGWDNSILTADGIDIGTFSVPHGGSNGGLPMMLESWNTMNGNDTVDGGGSFDQIISPSSTTSSSITQIDPSSTMITMGLNDGGLVSGNAGLGPGTQMMEEFEIYPLEDFTNEFLTGDLNTIEGLFHDDITLLGQPLSQQSPNLSGDSAVILSPSLPQQILGRSAGGALTLLATSDNSLTGGNSNSLSGFSSSEMQLQNDPMVTANSFTGTTNASTVGGNTNLLAYDEQTRSSSSPFDLYTKQEPNSAVQSPLAFSPSSHGSSPSITDGGGLLMMDGSLSGGKQQLQSAFNNNNNNHATTYASSPGRAGGPSPTISAGKLIKSGSSNTSNNNNSESAKNQNYTGGGTMEPSQMPQRAARRGINFSRNSGNVGQVQHNPKYSTLQQLLMSNTPELRGSGLLGQSVPSSSSGLLSPGSYTGRRLMQTATATAASSGGVSVGSSAGTSGLGVGAAAAAAGGVGGSLVSRLSSSAPTHISGFEQIWQRREPRPHLLSTGSLAEAGSTSSLSTGGILSPEAPDYSHDEGYSDDSDHYEDYSSGEDSDSEDTGRVSSSLGSGSKAKRYFWQYNVQAKGPKGQRLVIKTQAEDPHVLNAVTDPVFSPHCSVRGIKHSGKARKGDGNDLTPNPRKLHNIGKELDKLGRVINDMKPVSELPFNVRPKTRKEKNKLASRACRLKKKAQHEANKIKLYGLETEHKRLMNGIFQLKQILVGKCNNTIKSEDAEEYKQQLDTLVQTSSKIKIAGNSTEFVNKMLENVRAGNNISIDTVLENF